LKRRRRWFKNFNITICATFDEVNLLFKLCLSYDPYSMLIVIITPATLFDLGIREGAVGSGGLSFSPEGYPHVLKGGHDLDGYVK
jgi:hypothetical protein